MGGGGTMHVGPYDGDGVLGMMVGVVQTESVKWCAIKTP